MRRAWLVVRDSADVELRCKLTPDRFVVVRRVCATKERAQEVMQELWDAGERPQCRVEEYLVSQGGK